MLWWLIVIVVIIANAPAFKRLLMSGKYQVGPDEVYTDLETAIAVLKARNEERKRAMKLNDALGLIRSTVYDGDVVTDQQATFNSVVDYLSQYEFDEDVMVEALIEEWCKGSLKNREYLPGEKHQEFVRQAKAISLAMHKILVKK